MWIGVNAREKMTERSICNTESPGAECCGHLRKLWTAHRQAQRCVYAPELKPRHLPYTGKRTCETYGQRIDKRSAANIAHHATPRHLPVGKWSAYRPR